MTSRPTVTAESVHQSITRRSFDGAEIKTPGVIIQVEFQLHDHEMALIVLERAVADIRAQIEETRQ